MEVLHPLETPWVEEGDALTRCTTHDVTFAREESCPVGGCFGRPPPIAAENDAAVQLDDDEAVARQSAKLWLGVRDTLIARLALLCNRPRESALSVMAREADRRAVRWQGEATRLAAVRARRQKVDTLRKERSKTRRRAH